MILQPQQAGSRTGRVTAAEREAARGHAGLRFACRWFAGGFHWSWPGPGASAVDQGYAVHVVNDVADWATGGEDGGGRGPDRGRRAGESGARVGGARRTPRVAGGPEWRRRKRSRRRQREDVRGWKHRAAGKVAGTADGRGRNLGDEAPHFRCTVASQ